MSGGEALLALGLMANLANLVDFSCKTIARMKESRDNVDRLPKHFRDVQITLPLLAKAIDNTRLQIDTRSLDEEDCRTLTPVLKDCIISIRALQVIFEKSLPRRDSSKLLREWKAVLSLRQERKVEAIHQLLQSRVPILTYFHVATTNLRPAIGHGMPLQPIKPERYYKSHHIVPVQW